MAAAEGPGNAGLPGDAAIDAPPVWAAVEKTTGEFLGWFQLVRTFYQPWPYPIEGDQFGDVEYALDKADWQHDQPGDDPLD